MDATKPGAPLQETHEDVDALFVQVSIPSQEVVPTLSYEIALLTTHSRLQIKKNLEGIRDQFPGFYDKVKILVATSNILLLRVFWTASY